MITSNGKKLRDAGPSFNNKLCHSVISQSLCNTGSPNSFIVWIMSYLSGRKQRVRINSTLSDPANVTSGVPQGSVLCPALFSVVIADYQPSSSLPCVIKFADAFPHFANCDNSYIIQEHNSLIRWSTHNTLIPNQLKCKSLFIPRNALSAPIDIPNVNAVNELKLLGVTFTRHIIFNVHIKNTIAKLSFARY